MGYLNCVKNLMCNKEEKAVMIDINGIMKLLPHRYPFLMIDRVIKIKPPEMIEAYKNVSINEPYFEGHFPDNPTLPGVLIIEAMAQACGVLLLNSVLGAPSRQPMVTSIKIRFFHPVVPGDQLRVVIVAIKMATVGGIFRAEAYVNDKQIAKGEMTFACR